MRLLGKIEKSKIFWTLLITLLVFFFFRLPSLFEPYWYGDEGIYQVMGMGINHGRLLYAGIWDNKPPLLYLTYALFSSDQFSVRLFSLIIGLFSVIAFYFLTRKIFSKPAFATLAFSFLFAIPLLEGNIANAENFMLLPIILSVFFVLKSTERTFYFSPLTSHLLAGFLLSIAFLFKAVAVFDFAAILIFLLFVSFPKKVNLDSLFALFKKLLPFLLSFAAPFLLVSLFFFLKGAFWDFISATFVQNVGYVSWGNKFIFSQGLLLLKLILLFSFALFLFFKRNKIEKGHLFILLWFLFSLFNAFFSQRPYTHYLLVLLPSLILLASLIIYEKRVQKIGIISFLIIFILLAKNFTVYGKTTSYYQNFYSFILGGKTFSSYVNFFDRRTSRSYDIAQFLNMHALKNDSIFLWGNSAQIYKLTNKLPPGRYTVAYHITSSDKTLSETYSVLKKSPPKFIIVESFKDPIPFSLSGYDQKILVDESIIYERNF